MELCDGGDLKRICAIQRSTRMVPYPGKKFRQCCSDDRIACSWATEMKLRHYDVKLLNFSQSIHASGGDDVEKADLCILLRMFSGTKHICVTAPRERPYLIKLADYGTADISPETLGSEITMAQFTTFENVAPDFYILGMLS